MHCPVCKTTVLQLQSLEENLPTRHCRQCEGHWLPAFHYWKWQKHREETPSPSALSAENVPPLASDSKSAKVCPECHHILLHCRVGHGLSFTLDRCSHCGGMWFDCNEWEMLKSRNLHGSVHTIFSPVWQRNVHEKERQTRLERRWQKLLGNDDLAEIKRIKAWLETHPKRELLLSFLKS